VIGYTLDKALQLIGEKHSVAVESTITPYKDKIEERQGNTPIVVRQKVENDRIILTACLFK
jgi:topoisomerase IA-like protein